MLLPGECTTHKSDTQSASGDHVAPFTFRCGPSPQAIASRFLAAAETIWAAKCPFTPYRQMLTTKLPTVARALGPCIARPPRTSLAGPGSAVPYGGRQDDCLEPRVHSDGPYGQVPFNIPVSQCRASIEFDVAISVYLVEKPRSVLGDLLSST
jgi:hypothetical protein